MIINVLGSMLVIYGIYFVLRDTIRRGDPNRRRSSVATAASHGSNAPPVARQPSATETVSNIQITQYTRPTCPGPEPNFKRMNSPPSNAAAYPPPPYPVQPPQQPSFAFYQ